MTTRHTITHAEEVYVGEVHHEGYSPDGRRGLRVGQLFTHEFGAVAALDANGVLVSATATATGGTAFTLATGAALVSTAGTAVMDVPRNITISATGAVTSASGVTFTITGTDAYGETMSEAILGPSAATGGGASNAGAKAFKTVTAAACDAATGEAVNIGTANVLGCPVKVADKGKVIALSVDGDPVTPTIVAGLATGTAATTTNADVRGSITMATGNAPNGTKRFTALFSVPSNKRKIDVFGNTQA